MNIHEQLMRPFPIHKISWRPGNTNAKKLGVKPWEATEGSALAYIDARDTMKRLDDVCGTENWQCELNPLESGLVVCRIGIRASLFDLEPDGSFIWKSNGAGETDIEGKKGACSQAIVRAGSVWGIGRYLYALPFSWVKLHKGKILEPPMLPEWATPEGFDKLMEQKK